MARYSTVKEPTDVLTLVDGHYHLYKSYFATQNIGLCNQRGEPTNVVYGFMQQLERIYRELEPSHLAVMMDSRTSSASRRDFLPVYKADRSCPPELREQLPKVMKACEAMGVPCKESSEFEADDLIASYTRVAPAGTRVKIFSSDKDLLELVNDQVEVLYSGKDPKAPLIRMDAQQVWHKWGVLPEQIPDLLALMGDSADNIPGVPSIGQVRGARLLQCCGDLQTVVRRAQEGNLKVPGISPKSIQALREHGPFALELLEKVVRLKDARVEAEDLGNFQVPIRDEAWRNRVGCFCEAEDMQALKARLCSQAKELQAESDPRNTPVPARKDTGDVLLVATPEEARRAMGLLRAHPDATFAISSEAFSDAALPRLQCLSIYGGPQVSLEGKKTKVWVDFLGPKGDWQHADELLDICREFLADPLLKKVYHCFAETRRGVLGACSEPGALHGGFTADTMHLARLWDPSLHELARSQEEAYAVTWLAEHLLGSSWRLARPENARGARQPGDLQLGRSRDSWIQLCVDSAAAVFFLHQELKERLSRWTCQALETSPGASRMWDFYAEYWQPLATLLSDMELRGVPINEELLDELIAEATAAQEPRKRDFCAWASARVAEVHGQEAAAGAQLHALNLNSNQQLRQLLFGSEEKEFSSSDAAVDDKEEEALGPVMSEEDLRGLKVEQLKDFCREKGLLVSGKKADLVLRLTDPQAQREALKRPRRKCVMRIPGMRIPEVAGKTAGGRGQLTLASLQKLLDQRQAELGSDGLLAVRALAEWRKSEVELTGFLLPLREHCREGRAHARLNLNTMTGRLSSRTPNLQGEPGIVRNVVAAEPGRRLLVADYAQLELRLVAHLANCKAMIDILTSGGDIHSGTAYSMFDEVRQAVDEGSVFLDEGAQQLAGGEARPLVKDHFPELRKRAKTLNFALLYGKTAYSLGPEWGLSQREAQGIIDRWFAAFPEVEQWMASLREQGKAQGARTLLGRVRPLRSRGSWAGRGHVGRVAGNTPVQGSAADLVLSAMVRLERSQVLRDCAFRMVLQIHDELLLEGPEEHAEKALQELVRIMQDPLPFKLRVPLLVDACHVQTWHEAKA